MRPARGFTLIEVLVALVIMALAFSALLRVSGLAAENSATLRERMLAGWMAENRMARLAAERNLPPLGVSRGSWEQDDRTWVWEQDVRALPNPRLRRVTLRILAPGEAHYVLAELVAYVSEGRE